MAIEYNEQAKFVLDGVRFSHEGQIYKGQGFMEWNPATGFGIDALMDKTFAPVDAFKTLGQIIVNTKEDIFPIWLNKRTIERVLQRLDFLKPILRLYDFGNGGIHRFRATISNCAF
jgi:hypothetical protein